MSLLRCRSIWSRSRARSRRSDSLLVSCDVDLFEDHCFDLRS